MLVRRRSLTGTTHFSRVPSWCLTITICALLAAAPLVHAQVTTGNLTGVVTAQNDNTAMPGVTIEAVHVPTGTHYTAVTAGSGRFTIPNVRVGGPYTVTANLEGFKPTTVNNVQVQLGESREVNIKMQLAAVSQQITVTATTDPIMNPDHTGSTSSVTTRQIETLPTVNRTLQDFARTNPYFVTDLSETTGTTLNVAGRNNRYNNIQIDGAVNNDLFGLAGTGTPGGQTQAQPISLDAIQQLQLVVSPYDVRQSGFTGGGVNAVTRSGTNKWDGSVFGTKRNKAYIGTGPLDSPVSEFNQTQWGGRFGGPIVQDKMFFFLAGEENRKAQPLGASADGSTGVNYAGTGTGSLPSAQGVHDFVKTKYGLELGGLGDLTYNTNNNLLFGRLDFNLGSANNLTLRHNYVEGVTPVSPSSYSRSATQWFFETGNYSIADQTHSTVAQLNSIISPTLFNEGRIGYQTIKDARTTPIIFPTVEIGGSGERSGAIQIGTERFSGANTLDQKILEFTDDFTWVKGAHNIVFGTHNENFSFANLFISDYYGYYYFPTLDAFMANAPTRYRIGFANGADPRRATQFKAAQYSLYANDQWHMSNNFTLTFGLRADKPQWNTTPSFNPSVQTGLGYSTAAKPSDSITWEPRLGFNWDPGSTGKQQLRGGIGIFQGRAPYVWISNAYGGTGIETTSLACLTPTCTPPPFNPDPNAQPRNLGSGAVPSVAMTDPDFQFPRIMRSTLGYDRELWWGIRGTAEVLYSKTQKDIFYYNVNFVENGKSPLDGRPTYARITSTIGDAILLSNTSLGHETSETLQLSKTLGGLTVNANYMHQDSKGAGEGQSSVAYSGWQFNQLTRGDIFNPELGISSFQVKNRFNVSLTYDLATGSFSHSFGLFYAAQAGQPYSLLIGGDPNKDLTANNDLMFVPAGGASGLILCPAAASGSPNATAPCRSSSGATVTPLDSTQFSNFLSSVGIDPSKSEILPRNNINQPWQHRLDFHYELGLPRFHSTRLLVTADVINLMNLFDRNNGVQEYVVNQTYKPVNYVGIDSTTGKPIYREAFSGALTPGSQYSIANIASRWQGRLGLRLNF